MCSGKTNTTTQKQTTAPPPDVLARYQSFLGNAANVAQGPTVAPLNAQENQAFGQFGQDSSQYLPQAQTLANQGSAPITAGEISGYENPYQSDVINSTLANINETNAEQQSQVVGNALAQGALGGNRVGVAQGELARQQGLANNATIAGLNAQNYQQALEAAQADRSAAQTGAQLYGGLQTQALQGAAGLLGSGQTQQQQAAAELQQPYQQANWLSSELGTLGPLEGGTSTGATTQPAPNILSQLLGAGLTVAGLPGGSLGGQALSGIPGFLSGIGLRDGGAAYALGGIARRGGIMIRPHFAPGGIVTAPPQAGGIIANAFALANAMRGGVGGARPHFDAGGVAADPGLFAVPGAWSTAQPGQQDLQARLKAAALAKAAALGEAQPLAPNGPALPPASLDPAGATYPGIGAVDVTPGYDWSQDPTTAAAVDSGNTPANSPDFPVSPDPSDGSAPTGGIVTASAPASASPSSAAPSPPVGQGGILNSILHRPGNPELTAVGLGIMGGTSPFFGTNVGQGGLQGIQSYEQQVAQERQLAQLQAQQAYQNRSLDLQAANLDRQAAYQQAQLKLQQETPIAGGIDYTTGLAQYLVRDPSGNYVPLQTLVQGGDQAGSTAAPGSDAAAADPATTAALASGADTASDANDYTTKIVAGGLTQAAIDQRALGYLSSGTQPPIGRTGQAGIQSAAISNRMGTIGGNLTANKLDAKALGSSLTQQSNYLNTTQRAFNTANQTLQQLLTFMQQNGINPSQYPDFNSMANALQQRGLSGEAGTIRAFQAGITTLRQEYSQVLAKGGQRTDATDSEAGRLIPNNLSPADLEKVATRLQQEGTTSIGSAQAQINQIRDQINGIVPGQGGASGSGSSQTTPDLTGGTGSAATTAGTPPVGTVEDGYRFKGGDPSDQKNWEPVS